MRQIFRFWWLPLLLTNWACAPKLQVKPLPRAERFSPLADYEAFALLKKDTIAFPTDQLLGTIAVKDQGLSINCDFESVVALAEAQARQLGGNCLVITEHKLPNATTSSCHRIRAEVYHIENPERYEERIKWHRRRRLRIGDFKGSTEKRPFLAVTSSGFYYSVQQTPLRNEAEIEVHAYFDCLGSYFKRSSEDTAVLAHEQLHFDISEIYARQLVERFAKQCPNFKILIAEHERIYTELFREFQVKQDEYDSEVYADPGLQDKWRDWVQAGLRATEAYADKTLVLPLR
ncbi:MAG: hypothetical protein AAFW73_00430 [Bacteroidota bacterium]